MHTQVSVHSKAAEAFGDAAFHVLKIEKLLNLVVEPAKAVMGIDKPLDVVVVFEPKAHFDGEFNSEIDQIKINAASLDTPMRTIETLMHELVHYNQKKAGRLIGDTIKKELRWEGEVVDLMLVHLANMIDPRILPWEHEAYSQMTPLAQKVMNLLPAPLNS